MEFVDAFPLILESTLYGAYAVLFAFCVYVLYTRRRKGYRIHLHFTLLLFLLSTVHIIIHITLGFLGEIIGASASIILTMNDEAEKVFLMNEALRVRKEHWTLVNFMKASFLLSNIVADTLLIYRCYLICGQRKKVIIVPALLLLVTSAACLGEFFLPLYGLLTSVYTFLFTSLLTNIVVNVLTAGRIWWIQRTARAVLGRGMQKRYRTAIAILLESGIIYPICVSAVLITIFCTKTAPPMFVTAAILYPMVGIGPTLITVRVGLGVSTDDVESCVEMVTIPEELDQPQD